MYKEIQIHFRHKLFRNCLITPIYNSIKKILSTYKSIISLKIHLKFLFVTITYIFFSLFHFHIQRDFSHMSFYYTSLKNASKDNLSSKGKQTVREKYTSFPAIFFNESLNRRQKLAIFIARVFSSDIVLPNGIQPRA